MKSLKTGARRTFALLAIAFAVMAGTTGVPAPATAGDVETLPQGGGANNVTLVQARTDGATQARSQTQVTMFGGDAVASSNIASAFATGCTGCNATAVAVQVVMYTGSPQYFVPANAATAVNGGCTSCGTFAYAWQYVVQTDRAVSLTVEGRNQVQELRQEIDETAASIVPNTLDSDLLLQAKLDALTQQLRVVIDMDIQATGAYGSGFTREVIDRGPNA
jgi:hypothetical protein